MDYVRETLLRQAAIWRSLFGGEEKEETELLQEQRKQRQEEFFLREREKRGEELSFPNKEAKREENWRDTEEHRWAEVAEESPVKKQRGMESETLRGERAMQALWQEELRLRETERSADGADFRAEKRGKEAQALRRRARGAQSAEVETAAEVVWTISREAARTVQARELSRRFERDARRYDGGFIFY